MVAILLGRGGVVLLDAAFHFLEELFLQGLGVLHDFLEIILLGMQILEHFGIFAVAHPEIGVDPGLAMLGDLFGLPGGNWEGRHGIFSSKSRSGLSRASPGAA